MKKNTISLEKLNLKISKNLKSKIYEDEYKYRSQVNKVAKFMSKNLRYKFILVAGPSSSGKTTTSKLLIQDLKKFGLSAKLISLDDFFVERIDTPKLPNGDYDYENVNAIDWKLFDKCMSELINAKPIKLPVYDFITGNKVFDEDYTTLTNNEVIIIEGLHALNPIIDNFIPNNFSIKVYLKPMSEYYLNNVLLFDKDDVRFMRRMLRDNKHRGNSPTETKKMWETVNEGERTYITPYIDTANFKINTSHSYEVSAFKKAIEDIKKERHLENVDWFDTLLKKFEKVKYVNKNMLPKNSLLQEFLSGY